MVNHQTFPESLFPYLNTAALKAGISLKAMLKNAALDFEPASPRTPIPQLSGQAFADLLQAVRQAHPNNLFAVYLAEAFRFELVQEAEAFLKTCTTLMDAVAILPLLPQLLIPELRIELAVEGDFAELEIQLKNISPPEAVHELELLSALCISAVLNKLLPEENLEEVFCLRQEAAPWMKGLEVQKRLRITTLCKKAVTRIPARFLTVPLPGGFASLNARSWLQITDKIKRTDAGSFPEEIARHWDASKDNNRFSLDATALAFNLSGRTLQRKLEAEGITFQTLLDQYREALAKRYLQDPELDVESIAMKIGFEDRRSFTLAFKRWTQQTPRKWRQQN
ncbi:MAG: AraC family transcriptional regulator [Burkholderiales bacterium]|nr:AraC family transcriptional regulator [Burkholderiales bacterium]